MARMDELWNLSESDSAGTKQDSRKRQRTRAITMTIRNQTQNDTAQKEDKTNQANQDKLIFDDADTADAVLRFSWICNYSHQKPDGDIVDTMQVHVHSRVLIQSRYFEALLSKRWLESRQKDDVVESTHGSGDMEHPVHIHMNIANYQQLIWYLTTIRLLYTKDFGDVIVDVRTALSILPIAAELLFDKCITACVIFLEAVPWSREEEKQILQLVSHLQLEEAELLLARLGPLKENAVEDMLNVLVHAATHSNQNRASVKTFVAGMLSGHAARDTVKLVLEKAFSSNLKTVKDSLEEYCNPNVGRGQVDEIEYVQRQNLHTAFVNGRHLLWLLERMIELRVAKTAVTEWSEQDVFTANLKRAFSDDTLSNIAPGMPAVVLRCTCRLASAVAAGTIVVSRQVRLKLVNDWLPVLIVSRENPVSSTQNKQLHLELEDVFLKIILTLPLGDAQNLLQKCLSFATRTIEDCPHLVSAFNSWFSRASHEATLFPENE